MLYDRKVDDFESVRSEFNDNFPTVEKVEVLQNRSFCTETGNMGRWSLQRLNYIPLILGIVFAGGILLTLWLSLLQDHVSPYIPFISEAGGVYPEAGIFSVCLYLSTTMCSLVLFVRYLIVAELNRGVNTLNNILNVVSLGFGFIAMLGMMVVAAYPMTSIGIIHLVGSDVLYIAIIIYGALQTLASYRMSPHYNSRTICHIRLIILIVGLVAFISFCVLGWNGLQEFYAGNPDHWIGNKVPSDKGFQRLLASAVAEWTMAITFAAFILTFTKEFGNVWIHFRVQLLLKH